LKKLLDETPVSHEIRERIRSRIGRDFGGKHVLKSSPRSSSESLDQIRAEARQEWLKLRQVQTKESSESEIGRSADRHSKDNAKDLGLEFDDDSNE
jgi:hypothetical protein